MLREGDEPIPGYVLTRFLGKGTFGEVWQARTAGGFRAALKFVDLSVSCGLKEYRGIQRVKDIRHGRLMLMTALWMLDKHGQVIPDQLLTDFDATGAGSEAKECGTISVAPISPTMFVVAMPLADKSLLDLLQASGGSGIPLPDLIRYMEHAAEGLDFLNDPIHDLGEGKPAAIQHCDIKPANIMLMGNSAVICDFGLARILQSDGPQRSVSGMSGTYPYMAPECIDSPLAEQAPQPSFASDQYSLAVTYVELRTGRLPFSDEELNSALAILRAHCEGRLSLDGLSEAERAVIAKATSVNPADRYASNAKFVRHLRRAVRDELERAQALDPDSSLYSSTKIPSTESQSLRVQTDTGRVRDSVSFKKPARAPRSIRRPSIAIALLLAVAVAGGTAWHFWTTRAKVAEQEVKSPPVDPLPTSSDVDPSRADTPSSDPHKVGTPAERNPKSEKTAHADAATQVAEVLKQADRHAWCLSDPASKEGDWRAYQVDLFAVLKQLGAIDHASARDAVRSVQLELARIDARQQQWAKMFDRLKQAADPHEPDAAARLAPAELVYYRALEAIGNSKADAREVLKYLAAVDLQAVELFNTWEGQQVIALKDATAPHIERLLPLADPYDKLCDHLWPEGIAYERLERRAADALSKRDWAAARAAIDEARPLAKSDAAKQQLDLNAALLATRDPGVSATAALEAFQRAIPEVSKSWQTELTTALIERIESNPELSDPIIALLASRNYELPVDVRKPLENLLLPGLAKRIRAMLVREPLVFAELYERSEVFRVAGGVDPVVDVAFVEVMIETTAAMTAAEWETAEKLVSTSAEVISHKAKGFVDYAAYMCALVAARRPEKPDLAAAAELLTQAWNSDSPSGALRIAVRQERAIELLFNHPDPARWVPLVQAASDKFFIVAAGASPDDPQQAKVRDARVQLQLRLGEALMQKVDQQFHAPGESLTAAPIEQLLQDAETSAAAASQLLLQSSAAGPQRKALARAEGILGRVGYQRFKGAEQDGRKQGGATTAKHLEQAIQLSGDVEESALWRILLAEVQLELARAIEPELKRIQDKIAKLTLPADKKAVSERDEKPLVAERDQLLKQARATLQPIPPTNPHRKQAQALFKALDVQ